MEIPDRVSSYLNSGASLQETHPTHAPHQRAKHSPLQGHGTDHKGLMRTGHCPTSFWSPRTHTGATSKLSQVLASSRFNQSRGYDKEANNPGKASHPNLSSLPPLSGKQTLPVPPPVFSFLSLSPSLLYYLSFTFSYFQCYGSNLGPCTQSSRALPLEYIHDRLARFCF